MSIQFPPEFNAFWRMPGTKAAFVSEVHPTHPHDCTNCGGIGSMVTFCALAGPFDAPPVGPNVIAHYANGKWWGGTNYTANCPVCKGNGRNPDYKDPPARKHTIEWKSTWAHAQTGQTEPIQDDTYIPEME